MSDSAPAAPGPDAAAKQDAARRFEQAIKLYEDADYTLALAEFERVYELVPDYRVLYNIGQVSIQLGRYARAFRTLKEYVVRGGTELSPERAAAVQADLAQLEGKVARLSLQVQQPGAQISVDGVAMGRTPLAEPLVVDVGQRRVQVELAGYVTQSQTFTLAGGDRREGTFALQPVEVAAAPSRPSAEPKPVEASRTPAGPQPQAGGHRSSWLGVGWASTGVLAAGALVSGGLGASAASDLRDLRTTPGTTRAALDDAQGRASSRLLVADVLGGAALLAGGVTLYFQLKSSRDDRALPGGTAWRLLVGPNQVQLAFER